MTNAITKRDEGATLEKWLESKRDFLAQVLPKHVTPERLIKVALFARSRSPKLLESTPESLFLAILQCAEMGLEPTGATGGAWLVPFMNAKLGRYEATVIVDYRGMIDLAKRSKQVLDVSAVVVHEKDAIEIEQGDSPRIVHKPHWRSDPGKPIAVYAVAHLRGGGVHRKVLRVDEVNAIRGRSRAKDSGPWVTDYEAMALKTVLKQLCKLLPKSRELGMAMDLEESFENLEEPLVNLDLPQLEAEAPQTTSEKVRQRVARKTAKPVVDVVNGESEEDALRREAAEYEAASAAADANLS